MWRYDLGRFIVYTKTQHENDSFLRVDKQPLPENDFRSLLFLELLWKKVKISQKMIQDFFAEMKNHLFIQRAIFVVCSESTNHPKNTTRDFLI